MASHEGYNQPQHDDNHSTLLDAFLYTASAFIVILGGLLFTYFLLTIFDRFCSVSVASIPNASFRGLEGAFTIARKAGISGILPEERASVLARILSSTRYKEIKTQKLQGDADTNDCYSKSKSESNPCECEMRETSTDSTDVLHDKTSCAICLSEYDDVDVVTKSGQCEHFFHEACLLEWLQRSDVCPFCRKEITTPDEFKEVCREVLATDRYEILFSSSQETDTPDIENGDFGEILENNGATVEDTESGSNEYVSPQAEDLDSCQVVATNDDANTVDFEMRIAEAAPNGDAYSLTDGVINVSEISESDFIVENTEFLLESNEDTSLRTEVDNGIMITIKAKD